MTHSFPTRRSSDLRNGSEWVGRRSFANVDRERSRTESPGCAHRPLSNHHGVDRASVQRHSRRADNADRGRACRKSGGQPASIPGCSDRSEEHTSELQSLMRISYAVFCLKKNSLVETCIAKLYTPITQEKN